MKKKISNWMLIKFLTVSWSFLWKYLSSLINLFSSKSRQWTFACPAGRSLFFFLFSLSSTAVFIGKNENEIRRNNVNRILEEGRKKKLLSEIDRLLVRIGNICYTNNQIQLMNFWSIQIGGIKWQRVQK